MSEIELLRLRVQRAIERIEREVIRGDRERTIRVDNCIFHWDAAEQERMAKRRDWITGLPRVQWLFERDWRRDGWWWVAGAHWSKDVNAPEGEFVYRKRIELRWQFCWPRLSIEGFR